MRICAVRALVLAVGFYLCIAFGSASGGTIRHDRDDSFYTDLAAMADFQSVGLLRTTPQASIVSGTLVAPQWVLTAAHNQPLDSTGGTFELGGIQYATEQWVVHPTWTGALGRGADLALVRLQSPVAGITPAPLYTGSSEFNQIAIIVGYGLTGNGLTGHLPDTSGTKRAGENVIDALGSVFNVSDNYVLADFDSPFGTTSSFGDDFPVDLEYHTSIGDSGGGVFLDDGGTMRLAGVPSFVFISDDIHNSSYGEIDGYTRVSLFANWINEQTAPIPSWNLDADGAWSQPGNWTSPVPNAAGARSVFGPAITAPHTVTVDAPITVGSIALDNANPYTIAGASTLTLDSTTGDAQINVSNGNHVISAAIALADNAVVNVSPATSNLSLIGGVSGAGRSLNKSGPGTLTVKQISAGGLSIDSGTVSLVWDNTAGPSVIGTLSIAGPVNVPTARLDVNNSAAIINYGGASPAATVRQQIIAGRGGTGLGAAWNGMGITSAAAAAANATEPETRSLGYAENSAMPLGPLTTFRGQTVDGTSILMAYTRTGDANLDGVVNDDDVTIVGATYAPGVPNAAWALGDFDYNGFVDDDDVTLLGALYDPTATPVVTAAVPPSEATWRAEPVAGASSLSVAAVPEPTSLLLAVLAAALGLVLIRRGPAAAHQPYSKKFGPFS